MEPRFFFCWRLEESTHPTSRLTPPRRLGGHHLHLTLQRPTLPHLTPYRRGCPRRGLFRVLGHPKVFALLFPKNASYDILRAPRGILVISHRRRVECVGWAFPFPNPTLQRPTLPHLTPRRRGCPRRALFRVFDHPKVFTLLFAKNASYDILRAPRGIPAISRRRRGESVESG